MKKTILIFTLIIIIFITNSCIKDQLGFNDIRKAPWEAKWAVPLVNTSLALKDILNDTSGFIHEDEDGLLSLIYQSDNLVSIDASGLINIPDQDTLLEEEFILPDLPPGQPVPPIPVTFSFPFETEKPDQRIDSIYFNSGNYHLNITTDLNKDVASVNVIIPSLVTVASHQPLSFNINLANGGGGLLEWETDIDLSSYILFFEETTPNELEAECELIIVTDNNPNNSPYFFSIQSQFNELNFSYVFGYFDKYEVYLDDTIALDIFKLNQDGYFDFGPGSVNFDMNIRNSYGLPIEIELTKARAFHGGDNPTDSLDIFLFGEGTPNLIEINYPSYGQIGEIVTTNVSGENSNISNALNISPDIMVVDILGTLNPAEDSDIANFVLDESRFEADIELELELFGSASGFRLADTLDFSVDLGNLNSLDLIFDIENGFPIDATIWLHMLDSLGNKIYEVLSPDELLIAGGETGGASNDYRVINPEKKLTVISLDREGIMAVKNSHQIVVNAELSTTNGQLAKIYSDYAIQLKLGANLGYNY